MGTSVPPDLLPGTLDLLILKTLASGAQHGYGIARRRARYYTLTAGGRRQLANERAEFDRLITAIHKVLNAT